MYPLPVKKTDPQFTVEPPNLKMISSLKYKHIRTIFVTDVNHYDITLSNPNSDVIKTTCMYILSNTYRYSTYCSYIRIFTVHVLYLQYLTYDNNDILMRSL